MKTWQERAIKTFVAIGVLILLSSVVYHYLMITVEGRSPSYVQSLQVVVETYTGTGYGGHTNWDTTVANLFVTAMDLSTFLLVFIVLPYIFQPILAAALSPDLPESSDQSDHVVVCGYSPRVESLVEEFRIRGADHVVVLDDEDQGVALLEKGISIVEGDPTDSVALDAAGVDRATTVVVDVDDVESASTVLAARELSDSVRIVVLVEDPSLEHYLEYAGADRIITPRGLLGHRMAERVRTELSPTLSDTTKLGEDLSLVELTVFEGSELVGEPLESSALGETKDLRVLGLWKGGEFRNAPDQKTVIEEHDVLLVVGPTEPLERLQRETTGPNNGRAEVCLAGYGEVGASVASSLEIGGINCTIVDREEGDEIDVVGDVTDEETLDELGIEDVDVFVLSIPNDDQAILATLVARERNPDLDIIARVNDEANTTVIRRAGADYVLSLPEISGRILARDVLREQILAYDTQLRIVQVDGESVAGQTLEETRLKETSSILVGVERNGGIETQIADDYRFGEDDTLLLVSTEDALGTIESEIR